MSNFTHYTSGDRVEITFKISGEILSFGTDPRAVLEGKWMKELGEFLGDKGLSCLLEHEYSVSSYKLDKSLETKEDFE